jgi:hypothetical protein
MITKNVHILLAAGVMLFGVAAFAQEMNSVHVREQSRIKVAETYRAEVKAATAAGQNTVDAKQDQDRDRDRRMDGSGDKAQDRDRLRDQDHDQTKDHLTQQDRDRLHDRIGGGFGSATRSGRDGSRR